MHAFGSQIIQDIRPKIMKSLQVNDDYTDDVYRL